MEYKISLQDQTVTQELKAMKEAYDKHTQAEIGEEGHQQLVFFVRDEDGLVVAGIQGQYTNYGWLWVDLLWVSEPLRGKGYGSQLIGQLEQEARENGCTNAYLNSFSFQSVGFYKKLGYTAFGELEDFPPGHSVFCFKKSLVQ